MGEVLERGSFVSSMGKHTSENVIGEYVKNQGVEKEYKQLYLNLSCE